MTQHSAPDPRQWRAIVDRDPRFDGAFVFAVRTTGVCCRPSCGARRPHRKNVEVFVDVSAAQRAGYRACKRCQPNDQDIVARRTQLVERLCRRLEGEDPAPRLTELARSARMTPERLRRLFVAVVGVTPRDYLAQHRLSRTSAALTAGKSVTQAMLLGGYSSTSRFHQATNEGLGMMPKQLRAKAPGERLTWACVRCSLGHALVAGIGRPSCSPDHPNRTTATIPGPPAPVNPPANATQPGHSCRNPPCSLHPAPAATSRAAA